MSAGGFLTLQAVAERIVASYLASAGRTEVEVVSHSESHGGRAFDLAYVWQGTRHQVKTKPDPYYGTDPEKIGDRSLVFYRADVGIYAFETVADSETRQPGWIFESEADEIYYYFLAISQTEERIAELLRETDGVFFRDLNVERDALYVLPMAETRAWFGRSLEAFPSRPVVVGDTTAWCRLIPRGDLECSGLQITCIGPIFDGLRC